MLELWEWIVLKVLHFQLEGSAVEFLIFVLILVSSGVHYNQCQVLKLELNSLSER